jgi:hypothetical protein
MTVNCILARDKKTNIQTNIIGDETSFLSSPDVYRFAPPCVFGKISRLAYAFEVTKYAYERHLRSLDLIIFRSTNLTCVIVYFVDKV